MRYDLTVAENIGIGAVEKLVDRAEIERVAAAAGVTEFVNATPHGYDTMLSLTFAGGSPGATVPPTGTTLSGGQWQRLALARCLMRMDRDLLILDEPSSGLDAQAEHAIHQQLRKARAGRTSVLISHRFSTIRDADTIVVLNAPATSVRSRCADRERRPR